MPSPREPGPGAAQPTQSAKNSGHHLRAQPRRRKAALHRGHGVVDQEISEHRVVEGPADERCHHRVSQGRAPLSQPKVRKILDTTSALNLAAARLRYIAGTAWSTKRYLNIELLKDQQMRDAIPP